MKTHEVTAPEHVGLFGAQAVVQAPHPLTHSAPLS